MTKSVGVHEAKTHLSRLLDEVEAGAEVEISRRGIVIAKLVPAPHDGRQFGVDRGLYVVPDDFTSPLDDATQAAFEA